MPSSKRPAGLEGFETADGMFTVGGDQRIIQWNRAAESALGFRASEAIGRKCFEALGGPGSLCHKSCPVLFGARHGLLTPAVNVTLRGAGRELRRFSMSTLVAGVGGDIRIVHLLREATEPAVNGADVRSEPGVRQAPERDRRTPPPDLLLPLSRRETQVLGLLSQGKGTDEIAGALGVRRLTARNHIGRLMNKLGAETRLHAVLIGLKHGLVRPGGGGGET
jgi:DNA-binding CsgD family transcriptional regulator